MASSPSQSFPFSDTVQSDPLPVAANNLNGVGKPGSQPTHPLSLTILPQDDVGEPLPTGARNIGAELKENGDQLVGVEEEMRATMERLSKKRKDLETRRGDLLNALEAEALALKEVHALYAGPKQTPGRTFRPSAPILKGALTGIGVQLDVARRFADEGYGTVEELIEASKRELCANPKFGQILIDAVEKKLGFYDLSFKP